MNIAIITGANRLSCDYLIYQVSLKLKIVAVILEIQDFSFEDRPWLSEYVKDSDKCFAEQLQQKKIPIKKQLSIIKTGDINSIKIIKFIKTSNADVVLVFGSSILNKNFLSSITIPIINLHTGLIPYYRGSLSSLWCIFDSKPECLGSTIHCVTEIVDGGEIIHQVRPVISEFDTIHDLASKNFISGVSAAVNLLCCIARRNFPYGIVPDLNKGCLKKSGDFSYDAVTTAQENIRKGIIAKYLRQKEIRDASYPIVKVNF